TGAGNAVTVGGAYGSGAQEVQGPVQVQSTGGKTALTVDDAANPGSVGAFVDAAAVQGVTFYQIDFTPGDLAALAVLGGAYGNVFYVSGTSAGYTSTVNSGAGDDFVQVLATTGPVAIQGNAGSDTVVVGDAGLTGGVTNNVSVGNSGGQTALTVDDSANAAARSVEVTVPGSPVVGTTTGAVAGFTPSGTAISWVTGELSGIDLNTGTAGDTFNARPDVYTPITLNAGLPTAGVGDTLILNVVGVSNPVITDLSGGLPALPDGKVTSTSHATVTWRSIETFPVPLGLGGTFDFQPTRAVGDPNTQPGFLPVLPSDTPTSGAYAGAAGWLNPGAGAYNRLTQYGAGAEPASPQLARLLRDGEWGYAGGGTKNGVFQVAVAANQDVEVTVYAGDTYAARDNMNVYVGTSTAGPFTKLNPALGTLNAATGQFVSYSGVFNPGNNSQLVIMFETTGTGASAYWTVSGIDVRPVGLIAPLTITRVGGDATVRADGLTVDTYTGSGAAPGAELTISPQYGTVTATSTAGGGLVAGDRDAAVKGVQAVADANGNFSFSVLRSTGAGPALVTVTDVTGASGTGVITPTDVQPSAAAPYGYSGSGLPVPASPPPTPPGYTYQNGYVLPGRYFQYYSLPEVRRIDFGPASSLVATDFDPYQSSYLGWSNGAFLSKEANALGWVGALPSTVDRGAGSALQRDLAYGPTTAPGDYLLYTPRANADYAVTVTVGDMGFPRDNQFVLNVDPSNPNSATTLASGISTKAGEVTSLTFTVTSDAQGRIRLRFGAANGVSTFWAVEGIEVRPAIGGAPQTGQQRPVTVNGQAYSTAPTPTVLTTSYVADGTTPTSYSITGATPNSVLTVTASFVTPSAPSPTLLAVGTTDGSTSYTGFQVVATPGGAASFIVARPSYPQAAYAV
ncbi:MAG: hypothetical protein K2P78_05160, partial [Gemmataceae bacterium]|nr:hypothetical protein [Gemmataceae bacterium]